MKRDFLFFIGCLLLLGITDGCQLAKEVTTPPIPKPITNTVPSTLPKLDWLEQLEKDPRPVALPVLTEATLEQNQARIDHLRGQNLIASEDLMNQIQSLGESALPVLVEASTDADPDIRFKSTILLGESKDVRAAQFLVQRLNDSSEEVAMMAARSLANLGEPWVAPRLFECFAGSERHKNLKVRVEAARAAAKLGFPQAIPFLLIILKENTRLAEPFGGLKDWEWQERWAWEKWVAAEAMRELTGLDTKFDANQGIPQMEESVKPWIEWWDNEGSRKNLAPSVRNDLRFQNIVERLRQIAKSDDEKASHFARWVLATLKV